MQSPYQRAIEEHPPHGVPDNGDSKNAMTGNPPAGDGVWVVDNDQREMIQSNNQRRCIVALILIGVVVLLVDRWAARNRARYPAPSTWKSCNEMRNIDDDDDDDAHADVVNWDAILEGSPCSKSSRQTAQCFRQVKNQNEIYIWCGGYYYYYYYEMTNSRGAARSWSQLGTSGSLNAIWSDTADCDKLGMDEWQDVCLEAGAAQEDLEQENFKYCAMNQWQGFLSCDGPNFDYVDGVYTLSWYDDDRYDVPEDDEWQ